MVLHDATLIRRWLQHPFPPLDEHQRMTADGTIVDSKINGVVRPMRFNPKRNGVRR